MLARHLSRLLLGRLREGRVELVDGERPASLRARRRAALGDRARSRRALPGSAAARQPGAGRHVRRRRWDSDDLVALVRIGARELPRLDRFSRRLAPMRSAFTRIPRNTRDAARRHIAAHYDLGNDMFRTFLDETMTYSCAYFESPGRDAARGPGGEARPRSAASSSWAPDDHVVEIGTGWGSFAMHAAGRYGCRVTTTTISREQHELAVERVREAGLGDRVNVVLEDYRDLRGRFDKLVSIEMIEAVGWQYFDMFFRRCAELLRPTG